MSLLDRFFGSDRELDPAKLFQDQRDEQRPSLQLLFPESFDFDSAGLTKALRSLHPDLAQAEIEVLPLESETKPAGVVGVAAWGEHLIQLVGMHFPMPEAVVESCIQPAHYGPELKAAGRKHQTHLLLYSVGQESDPLEQYVALAGVCAAFSRFDALLVLNESARTSFPAQALLVEEGDGDYLEMLRSLPIPLLYSGFVKYNLEDSSKVWMRTYGNHLLGLPDLSILAEGHHQGSMIFDLFANVLNHLRESGATFGPGHTMQVGSDLYLKLRLPTEDEPFLESEGEMFVAELISANEINQ